MAIHEQLQPAARTPHVDLGASHIDQGQRDLGDCFACQIPVRLHFKIVGPSRLMVGCAGAAIAARAEARANQSVTR